MSTHRHVDRGTLVVPAGVLASIGLAGPVVAQTSNEGQAPSEQRPGQEVPSNAVEPLSPAADDSGWGHIGAWGIGALIVIVALIAWFGFYRPRTKPGPRSRP